MFSHVFMYLLFLLKDEVGALVFDVGSTSFRAGFAGEDAPKVRIYFIESIQIFNDMNTVGKLSVCGAFGIRGEGLIFIYLCSALLIPFKIDCFCSL